MDPKQKEVGRRISALRSGLRNCIENYSFLIAELSELPEARYAQMAEEAREEAETALQREARMSEEVSS